MKTTDELEFTEIDRQFGRFIARFGGERELVETAAARLSRALREGHICLDLATAMPPSESGELPLPDRLENALRKSPAFGPPEASTPLVLHCGSLFLRRYWDYEQALAGNITARARHNGPLSAGDGTQEAAVEGALQNRFTIISGGPGTGKTTAVLHILERFLAAQGDERPRIALTAPTGKAAARLEELLRQVQDNAAIAPAIKERMPRSASTIHRLLGPKPDSVFFRHDRRNPLPVDFLIVDEASMVALPLMAKLLDALPERARVILLGDSDQLGSVEPGSVLADLVEAASVASGPLGSALFVLRQNFRFGNDNAIYRLSDCVRAGDVDGALQVLEDKGSAEVSSETVPSVAQLDARLEAAVVEHLRPLLEESDPAKALALLSRFRVLCALREGPYGALQINATIQTVLQRRGLVHGSGTFHPGMPILVTRNDYQAKLFNGDVGVVLPDPLAAGDSRLWAWFPGADNQPRRISIARLPEYELAYAMTVHKAQGSEFDRVLLILPDRDTPILSRELIYTGITRARSHAGLWSDPAIFAQAVTRRAERRSCLQEFLRSSDLVE